MFKKIIAFTGAGISKDSGIPTFEEQPGIREKLTRDFAYQNPEEEPELYFWGCSVIVDKRNYLYNIILINTKSSPF